MGTETNATKVAQAAAALLAAMLIVPSATAQTTSADWQFTAVIYGYFPRISGSSSFPAGTASISVDPHDYLHDLKFAFMGALQAQKGPWTLFTDVVYADVSGSQSQTRNFTIGDRTIPANLTLDGNLKVTSTLWTLAGGYRVIATPQATLELFGGARYLDLKQTLDYNLNADIGPLAGPLRQGSSSLSVKNWDALVGAKGRVALGDGGAWFLPYYGDVGGGDSKYTYQLYGGLGYGFSWGEVVGVWRYIDYKFSDASGTTLKMNGPAIGLAFHW